jgi:RNA polymerase sigma factor (TIGR02999 family)
MGRPDIGVGEPGKITGLLKAWENGDRRAQEELIPLVYNELRELASRYRRKAGAGDTLQTTALVNEAYLRLVDIDGVDWRDRVHFFAVAANVMRRILIDIARAQAAEKRGGPVKAMIVPADWDEIPARASERAEDLLALDDALTRLIEMDGRRGKIVELRVFGGLSVEETAEALQVSPATVMRDWRVAKGWLVRELGRSGEGAVS